MERLCKPADIANLALFLAGDDSSWIAGSMFTIDGGIKVNSKKNPIEFQVASQNPTGSFTIENRLLIMV